LPVEVVLAMLTTIPVVEVEEQAWFLQEHYQ
jgi:hypothetical protein